MALWGYMLYSTNIKNYFVVNSKPVSELLGSLLEMRMLKGSRSNLSSGSSNWYVSHTSTVSFLQTTLINQSNTSRDCICSTCKGRRIFPFVRSVQHFHSLHTGKHAPANHSAKEHIMMISYTPRARSDSAAHAYARGVPVRARNHSFPNTISYFLHQCHIVAPHNLEK
jgi:hypothetical protein